MKAPFLLFDIQSNDGFTIQEAAKNVSVKVY